MTGRGIDQIMPAPSEPRIYEGYLKSALDYVRIADEINGPIPREVSPEYIWGDALDVFARVIPDVRIINLETTITRSEDWEDKGINYRMSPENASCLSAAGIDVCSVANNHILDWGEQGLIDTLENLKRMGIQAVGAGRAFADATRPAAIECLQGGRIIVFGIGTESSGVPKNWAATQNKPGIFFLEDWSDRSVTKIQRLVSDVKRPGDVAVLSIHWGPNWGYDVPHAHQWFAHALIDEAQIDIIHGHSSHHAKGIEVYRDKLILYGCGDFITDYEGIRGYEEFRGDFGLMYFPRISMATGKLQGCVIVPLKMKRFQLVYADHDELRWLRDVLSREGRKWNTSVSIEERALALSWV